LHGLGAFVGVDDLAAALKSGAHASPAELRDFVK
jgi:hypothetical protein